jgi:N-methylhydantoinase A
MLLHGSTVATNALLERKGARVKLVTNAGFEDIIEIGRQNRPQLYALVGHRPPPLVDREDRHGIQGRIGPEGEVIEPLDTAELEGLPELLADAESVAVILLHSYANVDHEEAVADALDSLGLPLSVSVRLLPEYREYERTSTTIVNAYVAPLISAYLKRLAREAGAERLSIMGSNGGSLSLERAAREPVHTVLSGPTGGVVGALAWGRRAGQDHIITFDMGGTSTDVSLCPGAPLHTKEFEIGGQPVAIPVIDIHTVGAGGGSMVRIDPGGALRVGPESAGADPGPICYGNGGTGVTVTDAHVWLGRLPTDAFLGGSAHWIARRSSLISEQSRTVSEPVSKRRPRASWGWPTPRWSAPCESFQWSEGTTPRNLRSLRLVGRVAFTPLIWPNAWVPVGQ